MIWHDYPFLHSKSKGFNLIKMEIWIINLNKEHYDVDILEKLLARLKILKNTDEIIHPYISHNISGRALT